MLILVRHGRTAANAGGLLQGRLDLSLDDVGRRQAREVAAAIGSVDVVITSPLARAVETAQEFGVDYRVDERWLELDYGTFDGLKLSEVPTEMWNGWRRDPGYAPPEGESMRSLDVRVRDACDEALAIARDRDVVIVSHVSPIKAAVAWALGADVQMAFRCHLEQAGVCRVVAGPSGPVLRSFNEVLYTRD